MDVGLTRWRPFFGWFASLKVPLQTSRPSITIDEYSSPNASPAVSREPVWRKTILAASPSTLTLRVLLEHVCDRRTRASTVVDLLSSQGQTRSRLVVYHATTPCIYQERRMTQNRVSSWTMGSPRCGNSFVLNRPKSKAKAAVIRYNDLSSSA